jgi:hypothetical protein
MKSCRLLVTLIVPLATISASRAHADVCNSSGACLTWGNSGTGPAMSATSVSGIGVYSVAQGSSPGVEGHSSAGNGLIGYTSTNGAAAVSAVPPSSSGIAFWGGGQIIITGTASKPGGGSWANSSSDKRVKKDVTDFRQGLSAIERVRPVYYKYNGLGGTEDDGREYVGVIAQELEKIAPAMVGSRKAKLHKTDVDLTDIKTVDESAFTYMLINSVKEQQATIRQLQARVDKLEARRPGTLSWLFSAPVGGGVVALGLLPVGLLAARRRSVRASQG